MTISASPREEAVSELIEAIRTRLRCSLAVREASREATINKEIIRLKNAEGVEKDLFAILVSLIAEEEGIAT